MRFIRKTINKITRITEIAGKTWEWQRIIQESQDF